MVELGLVAALVVVLKIGLVVFFVVELEPEVFLAQLEQHWFESEMVVAEFALAHLLAQDIHLVDLPGLFVSEFLERLEEIVFFPALPAFSVEFAVSVLLLAIDLTVVADTVFPVLYLS